MTWAHSIKRNDWYMTLHKQQSYKSEIIARWLYLKLAVQKSTHQPACINPSTSAVQNPINYTNARLNTKRNALWHKNLCAKTGSEKSTMWRYLQWPTMIFGVAIICPRTISSYTKTVKHAAVVDALLLHSLKILAITVDITICKNVRTKIFSQIILQIHLNRMFRNGSCTVRSKLYRSSINHMRRILELYRNFNTNYKACWSLVQS